MRVIFDTNLLISLLLSRNAMNSAIGLVLRAALSRRYTLLFVHGVAEEFDRTLNERPDLAARISFARAARLVRSLRDVGEQIPRLPEPYPEIGRDRKEDFLIAHAVAASADYLVSWDKDLRDLRQVDGVRIVSPPVFLQILRDAGLVTEGRS